MRLAFTPLDIELAIVAPDLHWLKATKWPEHWYADVPEVVLARQEAEARVDGLCRRYRMTRDAVERQIDKLKERLNAEADQR
jgi:hypothetical protein